MIAKNHLKTIKSLIIKKALPDGFYMKQTGYCPCCDQEVVFFSRNSWLRDHLICSNCNSIPRERALMVVIQKYLPNWKDLVIHESSPCDRGASLKLKLNCPSYQPSQYFPKQPLGSMVNKFRNENLEKLSLHNESVDLFITQDVLEHVYNPSKVFSEIGRV